MSKPTAAADRFREIIGRLALPYKWDIGLLSAGTAISAASWLGLFYGGEEPIALFIGVALFVIEGIFIFFTAYRSNARDIGDFHFWLGLLYILILLSLEGLPASGGEWALLIAGILGGIVVMFAGYSYHVKQQAEQQPLLEAFLEARELYAERSRAENAKTEDEK